jgi:hypothetical protein
VLFYVTRTAWKKRVNVSVEQLQHNLCQLIQLNPVTPDAEENGQSSSDGIRPREERTPMLNSEKVKLREKLLAARQKRVLKEKKKRDIYIVDQEKLVGMRIKHNCADNDDAGDWFDAQVLALGKKSDNPLKTEYTVKYDIDDDDTSWQFNLLMDLKKGDLIILDGE